MISDASFLDASCGEIAAFVPETMTMFLPGTTKMNCSQENDRNFAVTISVLVRIVRCR